MSGGSYTVTPDWTTLPEALLPLAKQHCRVDFPDDDIVITEYLQWAIGYCEQFWHLAVFSASVDWTPAPAGLARYQCPVQPVASFTVMSGAVDVSSEYALEQGSLTQPVWLVKKDGQPFPADAGDRAHRRLCRGRDHPAAGARQYPAHCRLALRAPRIDHHAVARADAVLAERHARRPVDTQGMSWERRTKLVSVDNPEFSTDRPENETNPRTIEVVSLRESSIVTLAAHGVLDADQVAAAFRFRHAWETVQRLRPAALGFDEWIGGGCRPAGFAEVQMVAAADLRLARRLLGAHGYELVARICGDGFHIRDIRPTRRERDTATDMLKVHLTGLARLWGH